MKLSLENASFILLALLLVGVGLLAPISQDAAYHSFADTRTLFGVPNAADVLSNLLFIGVGLWALALCASTPNGVRSPLNLFSMGLVLTGIGSAFYHASPGAATLMWDRLPMVLAFSGVIGALAYQYLGSAATYRWFNAWLYLGFLSVALSVIVDDLRLYSVVQVGGFLIGTCWMLAARFAPQWSPSEQGFKLPWHWLWLGYAVAKVTEHADAWIWSATAGLVGGHTLKHVIAALAVVPVLVALRKDSRQQQ